MHINVHLSHPNAHYGACARDKREMVHSGLLNAHKCALVHGEMHMVPLKPAWCINAWCINACIA